MPYADIVVVAALTLATGEPACYPWIIYDAPETGNGFEDANAYAVAKQLGFEAADVTWVRTTLDHTFTAPQAIVSFKGSKIDGLVVDLPTTFYLSGDEFPNGIIVGQLPSTGAGDRFGLLLSKGSKLTSCVSTAVNAITTDASGGNNGY